MRHSESAPRGQKIMTETAPDRSTDKADKEAVLGKKMGGSATNTEHSLTPNYYGNKAPASRK